MNDCIFCKIAIEEMPSYKIYEDSSYMAFLDISPQVKGHVLVVPKQHVRWVDDLEDMGSAFCVAQKIGLAAKKVLGSTWVSYVTVGVHVHHAHIHVLPRHEKDGQTDVISFGKMLELDKEEMQEIADSYKTELGGV